LGTLKKLIEELSFETSQDSEVMEEETGHFFNLYNTIINIEGRKRLQNEMSSNHIIISEKHLRIVMIITRKIIPNVQLKRWSIKKFENSF
jgi:hypothetical protein